MKMKKEKERRREEEEVKSKGKNKYLKLFVLCLHFGKFIKPKYHPKFNSKSWVKYVNLRKLGGK